LAGSTTGARRRGRLHAAAVRARMRWHERARCGASAVRAHPEHAHDAPTGAPCCTHAPPPPVHTHTHTRAAVNRAQVPRRRVRQ
jgi:hypothetical protein